MTCLEGLQEKKPLLSKRNTAARLKFAKLHLNKQQDFRNSVLWTDETKVGIFDHNAQHYVCMKNNLGIPAQTSNTNWWRADDLQPQDLDTLL